MASPAPERCISSVWDLSSSLRFSPAFFWKLQLPGTIDHVDLARCIELSYEPIPQRLQHIGVAPGSHHAHQPLLVSPAISYFAQSTRHATRPVCEERQPRPEGGRPPHLRLGASGSGLQAGHRTRPKRLDASSTAGRRSSVDAADRALISLSPRTTKALDRRL